VNFTGGSNPTADPQAEFPREIYYIARKTTETRDVISWDLASSFDMQGVAAPKRRVLQMCQWKYKGSECTYAGALPTCCQDTGGLRGALRH